MNPEVTEWIGPVLAVLLIGLFVLLFPLSRRLGGVMEEWIKLKRATSPDQERLSRLEMELGEVRRLVEGVDQRIGLLTERQDFMESLNEARRAQELPAVRSEED